MLYTDPDCLHLALNHPVHVLPPAHQKKKKKNQDGNNHSAEFEASQISGDHHLIYCLINHMVSPRSYLPIPYREPKPQVKFLWLKKRNLGLLVHKVNTQKA